MFPRRSLLLSRRMILHGGDSVPHGTFDSVWRHFYKVVTKRGADNAQEALQGKNDLFLNVSSAAVEKLYYHAPFLCFLAVYPMQVSYLLCGWPLHL